MAGRTDSSVIIEAPLDLVWDMANDVESWPKLFTEYAGAEILERDGVTIRFRLTTHPDEDGKTWSWVSERTADRATRTVRARRIETGPLLEYMNIYWEFEQLDTGVRMRWIQDFTVRPAAPVDDRGAEEFLRGQTLTEMRHIKETIERAAGKP